MLFEFGSELHKANQTLCFFLDKLSHSIVNLVQPDMFLIRQAVKTLSQSSQNKPLFIPLPNKIDHL